MTEPKEPRRGFLRPETVDAEPELLDYLDRLDEYDPDLWERAIAAKRAVEPYSSIDVAPAPPDLSRPGTFVADGHGIGAVAVVEHPAQHASFGFVGSAVELRLDGDVVPGTLYLPLDDEAMRSVEPASVTLFRWDGELRVFDRVVPSGARVLPEFNRDDVWHTHVWGRVRSPGVYVAVGLSNDPAVRRTLVAFLAARDLFNKLGPESLRGLRNRLCELILCAPDLGGFGGAGDVCDRCFGLDLSIGLPELELLHPKLPGGGVDFFPCIRRCSEWQGGGPAIWHGSQTVDLAGCSFDITLDTSSGTANWLYTASANGGIWRRSASVLPGAAGWAALTDDEQSLITSAVAVAPSNAEVVYYADGLGYVLRSDDHGRTWRRTSWTTFSGIRRILVDHTNPLKVYVAASGQGFYASADGGATWTLRLTGQILDAAMDPGNGTILYAGQRNVGLHKSYDAGTTWQLLLPWATPGVNPGGSSMIKIALGKLGTDASRIVAVKFGEAILVNRTGGRPPGTVGGGPWSIRGGPGNPAAGNGQGDWSHCIAIDPFDDDVHLGRGTDVVANGGWRTDMGAGGSLR